MTIENHSIVIVTGSRNLTEHWRVWWVLDQYNPDIVIEGNCPTGADAAARKWLRKQGRPTRSYTAQWSRYDNAAGPIRNEQMLRDWPTARVLAFPVEGEKNKGTIGCMKLAWSLGMTVENFSSVIVTMD
jgi:hypothetical protein